MDTGEEHWRVPLWLCRYPASDWDGKGMDELLSQFLSTGVYRGGIAMRPLPPLQEKEFQVQSV